MTLSWTVFKLIRLHQGSTLDDYRNDNNVSHYMYNNTGYEYIKERVYVFITSESI